MTWRSVVCSPERPSTKANSFPASWRTCLPDAMSQKRTVSSRLALTTYAPSSVNSTRVTKSECPVSVRAWETPQIQIVSNGRRRKFPSPGNPIKFYAPPSAHMAAHLDSGLGVPDLHEVVLRPADDAIAVPRESDGPQPVEVTRQRAHLPPTHLYFMGGPEK